MEINWGNKEGNKQGNKSGNKKRNKYGEINRKIRSAINMRNK